MWQVPKKAVLRSEGHVASCSLGSSTDVSEQVRKARRRETKGPGGPGPAQVGYGTRSNAVSP